MAHWISHLPSDARSQFLEELISAVQNGKPTEALIASWKSTAEVYSDPELYRKLTTPSGADEEDENARPVVPADSRRAADQGGHTDRRLPGE